MTEDEGDPGPDVALLAAGEADDGAGAQASAGCRVDARGGRASAGGRQKEEAGDQQGRKIGPE